MPVPGSASTTTASALPECPASVGAWASANQVRAPASAVSRAVSAEPARATPATRKSCCPAAVSSTTVSPTVACAVRAVFASSTTSPARGAEPLVSAVPVKAWEPQPCAVSTPPGTDSSRAPEPAPSSAACTGKVKSATAVATPGASPAFAASPASIRAVSGSGVASLSRSSPPPVTTYSFWSAAATTGAFVYRSGGTEARRLVSSRIPQAETISADISSARKVPAKDAGLKRTASRASPLGRLMPQPPSSHRSGRCAR